VKSSGLLVLLFALGACGPATTFGLSQEDNDPALLGAAMQHQHAPTAGKPVNGSGKPMAFLVTSGKPRKVLAWDLGAGKAIWTVPANVTSRIAVGRDFIVAREDQDKIVGRNLSDGQVRWTHQLPARSTFLGVAADGGRAFYTIQDDSGADRTWFLVAVEGGKEIWRAQAPGSLGAPAARGGLVYMPFLTQWLSILDASNGELLARLRQSDEQVTWVRTTSGGVYYGSKGVIALDQKSVAGTKQGTSYTTAKVPDAFAKNGWWPDAFNPVQQGYSAFDRLRLLWWRDGSGGFSNDLVIAFSYRFFFAFDAASGELRWAHQHTRSDLVAVEDVGSEIVYASASGEIGAIDARTGAPLGEVKAGVALIGGMFDAEGYAPKDSGTPPETTAALVAIIANKDTRFTGIKQYAVSALGLTPGEGASQALLGVILDDGTPPTLAQRAGDALIARKDPTTLPAILKALKVHADYLTGQSPRALSVLVRAAGSLGDPSAVPALTAHLTDPATPAVAIKDIADALVACKGKDALEELGSFLLLHRADTLVDAIAMRGVIDALIALGGAHQRQLVSWVAADPRTSGEVVDAARAALEPHKIDKGARPADK
jgi:outer membrane protein assembly factor BamB